VKKIGLILILLFAFTTIKATYILIPMDAEKQANHLKAYGITYWVINQGIEAYWLLNYMGGSFAFPHSRALEAECKVRGVSYQIISDAQWINIRQSISNPEVNQEAVKLEKAPKIAVYTPDFNPRGGRIQPWDDAVTLVFTVSIKLYRQRYNQHSIQNLSDFRYQDI